MEKRTGLWIPLVVMKIKNLDWENKILLTEILSLHRAKNGCIASNQYFGCFLGMTSGAASKRISKLIKSGYIKSENIFRNGSCIGRVIIPDKSLNDIKPPETDCAPQPNSPNSLAQVVPAEPEVSSLNDHTEVNLSESTSLSTISVHPNQPEGTSLTTTGVLPEQPKGTSTENTINTDISKKEKEIENQQEQLKQTLAQNTGPISDNFEKSDTGEFSWGTRAEARKVMNYWFQGYPAWESDLNRIGLEEFIHKTQEYHFNNPEYIGLIVEYWNR